ncbi:hypothetical protein BT96DRAFT_977851 [Gymnopus androsaceus JB14]|uniref:Uncharacterized protein n=1 Tax=Gymnopus androsaceus JB14 TaxID=1447944 RepID=A0A6A4HDC9_9AGAR|nr:hypothetical protein BT96DRAFT_977851 [Gymnopus androsaceus JB14]
MQFITKFLALASITAVASACTGIFQPCSDSAGGCCDGLSCTVGSPLGNCMPTPGVCGQAGWQCSIAIPTDSCCSGLTCSGDDGSCNLNIRVSEYRRYSIREEFQGGTIPASA